MEPGVGEEPRAPQEAGFLEQLVCGQTAVIHLENTLVL